MPGIEFIGGHTDQPGQFRVWPLLAKTQAVEIVMVVGEIDIAAPELLHPGLRILLFKHATGTEE